MKKVALTAALLVIVAIPATAIPMDYIVHPDFMSLKLGAYSPLHSDLKDNFSPGFNGEWAIGHYFHPNMAMEFSIGYFDTSGDDNGLSAKFLVVPILLNIKGVIPMARGEIYALAGGGFYAADAKLKSFGYKFDDGETTFGWQVGIGGNYNLSETVFLGIEGKYLWAKLTFDTPGIIPGDVHLDGIQATANIGYRW